MRKVKFDDETYEGDLDEVSLLLFRIISLMVTGDFTRLMVVYLLAASNKVLFGNIKMGIILWLMAPTITDNLKMTKLMIKKVN